jgi:N utilization substance protein A
MFDLKAMKTVIDQLEEERGIPREKLIEAIEAALATAYKKEYGKRGQIVRAKFSLETGTTEFFQVKVVVDETMVVVITEGEEAPELPADDERVRYNSEHHILLDEAQLIKKDTKLGDEMVFPLESKDDYGRIAAQTAKQVIIQKIREAEKVTIMNEFGKREGDIVAGTVQRVERGSVFIDLGKASGVISAEEQIHGESWNPGDRICAYLFRVEESPRGIFLRLSRSHPKFLEKLFEAEVPEIASGTVEVKSVAREAGARSKIAVWSNDEHIDPIGSLVGGRGVRVNTVSSELNGEKIDIVEWLEDPVRFIEEALSPAEIGSITLNNDLKMANVIVAEDQLSLAIGKGGQNVRLAAKLTGWKIDIKPTGGTTPKPENDTK